jgi:hypothetical protein
VGGRRPTVASVIGALAIVVAVSGSAVATTGGHLTLGDKNQASKTTTIANSKGVALGLRAKAGSPPFSVRGDKTQVPSLDSSLLDGIAGPSLVGALHVCLMANQAGSGGGVAGVAGSGGQGADVSQPQLAGSPGYVMVEFFT